MTTATTLRGTPTYAAAKFSTGLKGGGVLGAPGVLPVPSATLASFSGVNMTIEGWIMLPAAPGATKVAFGQDAVIWVGVTSTGMLTTSYYVNGTTTQVTLTGATSVCDGAWHHVAVCFTNGVVTFYADGVQVATNASVSSRGNTASTYNGLAMCGFGTLTSFDWPSTGAVDEIAVSTVAQYSGTTYTVPTAAFTGARANQTHLWHLDGDGTDAVLSAPGQVAGLTATTSSGQVSLSWAAPATDGGSAITDYTVQYRTTAGPGAWTTFTHTAQTTTTITVTGLTNGTGYDFQVAAVNSIGTGTYSATASATPGASVAIAPNDANIVYSPYNWDVTASRALTNCAGAYLRTLIGGTPTAISLTFDASSLTGTFPTLFWWRVDGGAWTQATVAATVALTLPTVSANWTKRLVEVVIKTSTASVDRWNSPYVTAAKFTGLTVAPNSCTTQAIQTRPLKGVVFGDSITEGISVLGTSGDETTRSDALMSYAHRLGDALGAEVGVVGFGGTGLTAAAAAGTGQVPPLSTTWNLQAAGISRSFATAPDFIAINEGTNDSRGSVSSATFQTALTSLLNAIIAGVATTPIFVLLPFGGYYGAAVYQAAIAACTTPSRVTFVSTTGWWSTADSGDNLHPYGYAHLTQLAPRLAAAVRTVVGGTSKRFVNVGGVAKAVCTVVKG